MAVPIKVSIIIPSYNGASKISGVLDVIAVQSVPDIETIVVVDGSTDNTEQVLDAYRNRIPNLKVIVQRNEGRSIARNNGARQAIGEILIFYDDDVTPSADSVSEHLLFHGKHFGLLCGNPVEIPGSDKTDIQNYKAWLTRKWTSKYRGVLTSMEENNLFFTAANCSVRKSVFWQLHGFDERMRDGEDYDLAIRSLKARIPVHYDKSNIVVHNEDITCRRYIRRLREYSKSQSVNRKNKKRSFAGLKRIVYRTFAFRFWVRLIDAEFFAHILTRPLRYRLYTLVIQALAYEFDEVKI